MKHVLFPLLVSIGLLAVASQTQSAGAQETPKVIRAGMIGLDTSHVPAFTKLFNGPQATGDLAGLKIVAGYPGGTDIPASKDRVAGFTKQIAEMGVEIVPTIPALLEKVDVVLLESVDGRIHLEQLRPVFEAKKPVYIDKPAAASLVDVLKIYALAKKHNVPCFSASSLRFAPAVAGAAKDPKVGKVAGCVAWSPCHLEPTHPDLFYYGIHGVESLYTVMGKGCETVVRTQTPDTDVVTGTWKDGRVGTFRGIRTNKQDYGVMVFGDKANIAGTGSYSGYDQLCQEIAKFFKTGVAPVSAEETIEIFTFMEAADESKRRGGAPVSLAETLAKAQKAASAGN
jgi:hypothetical protein